MPRNLFADPAETGMDAFDRAYDRQQGITDRITTNRAGRKLAGGDRRGAAATFAKGGLIGPARQLEADQQSLDDREAEAAAGEQEQQARMAAQRAAFLKNVAQGLTQVPPGERRAQLEKVLPIFADIGLPVEQFAAVTEEQLSDASLAAFGAELQKAEQEYTLPPGAKRYRGDALIADNPSAPPRPTIVPGGSTVLGPDNRPVYTAPKTFAPRSGGGRGGAGLPPPPSGWRPAQR